MLYNTIWVIGFIAILDRIIDDGLFETVIGVGFVSLISMLIWGNA